MQLSKRLSAVADMVTSRNCLADIGTDHGYIPIHLVECKRTAKAVAMDIHRGPLTRAEENIRKHGLEKKIETRLSDGLTGLAQAEADSVVIAGMGGGLVIKILKEGRTILESVQELILQPQSEIELVRRFLQADGYRITAENMILEDGKFYPMMRAEHGQMKLEKQIEFKYGPLLLREKNNCLRAYLQREEAVYKQIYETLLHNKNEKAAVRQREVEEELEFIREAKKVFEAKDG